MRLVFIVAATLLAARAASAQLPPTETQGPPRGDVSLIASTAPLPPATPQHADASVIHGVTVKDPYRWLENPDDTNVQQWIKMQNAYTEAELAAMPQGKALTARVQHAGR